MLHALKDFVAVLYRSLDKNGGLDNEIKIRVVVTITFSLRSISIDLVQGPDNYIRTLKNMAMGKMR